MCREEELEPLWRATGPSSGPSFSTQPGSQYLIVEEPKVLCTRWTESKLSLDTLLVSRILTEVPTAVLLIWRHPHSSAGTKAPCT